MANRVAPVALDPIVSLAVAMAETPGSYALLLGAGVSREADVPTGDEVRRDTLRRLRALEEPNRTDLEGGLDDWAAQRGLDGLAYADALERFAPDLQTRRAYLASFFEGKEPGESHRRIASLVAEGTVKVIVTTNFDRLLEHAIQAVGVDPVVVASDDALRLVEPREHAHCFIVKPHGDALQLNLRNTPAELDELDPGITAELRAIFQAYGIVAIGYSGRDAALGRLIRERGQRFGLYWLTRGELNNEAEALVEAGGGRVISRTGAAELLTDLSGLLAAYRRHPTGRSPQTVRSEVIEALATGGDIRLGEIIRRERKELEQRLRPQLEAIDSPNYDEERYRHLESEFAAVQDRWLAWMLPLVEYSQASFDPASEALRLLAPERWRGYGNYSALINPPRWIAFWLTHAVGAFAVHVRRFDVVRALYDARFQNDVEQAPDALATMIPGPVADLAKFMAMARGISAQDPNAIFRLLFDQLSRSSLLADEYPDFASPDVSAMRFYDFSWLVGVIARSQDASAPDWFRHMHAPVLELPARLRQDRSLRIQVARGALGIPPEEFDDEAMSRWGSPQPF